MINTLPKQKTLGTPLHVLVIVVILTNIEVGMINVSDESVECLFLCYSKKKFYGVRCWPATGFGAIKLVENVYASLARIRLSDNGRHNLFDLNVFLAIGQLRS